MENIKLHARYENVPQTDLQVSIKNFWWTEMS